MLRPWGRNRLSRLQVLQRGKDDGTKQVRGSGWYDCGPLSPKEGSWVRWGFPHSHTTHTLVYHIESRYDLKLKSSCFSFLSTEMTSNGSTELLFLCLCLFLFLFFCREWSHWKEYKVRCHNGYQPLYLKISPQWIWKCYGGSGPLCDSECVFRAGAPSSWALFPSGRPVWASSRHNYLSIISSFHGPGAQPHHDLSHAPVSKSKAAALPELASLSLDAIAIHFHESQLCSEHRQPDTGTEVVALLEGLLCMLENRL